MNLRDTILREHSKINCDRIVKWIGGDQQRFDELFRLFLHDEQVVMQRAAWAMCNAAIACPRLVTKHFPRLLSNLERDGLHDAVKRNTVRLLEDIDIPMKYQGQVMNMCFDYVLSPSEKPAVKASSLTILQKLSRQYPEIKQEIKTIIDDRREHETAAFRSRAKRVLASFRQ